MQTTALSKNWQTFYDSARHNDVLDERTAGLADVRVEDLNESCCATSCGGETAAVSIFTATGIRERLAF
jgi:hypothetical protein